MNIKIIITAIAATISITSCQKKEAAIFDPNTVSISISKPTEAQIFMNGDTVFIKAEAAYSSELHGYMLSINNKADSTKVYFDIDKHIHGTSVTVDTFWVNNLSSPTDLKLNFTIEADHDGHSKLATLNFKTQ